MDRDTVFGMIRDIVSDQLGIDVSAMTFETSFVDDLDADSLDLLQLVTAIEDEFDIQVPDTEFERIVTVDDAVEAIARLKADA
ncbi:MAG: acyl carrier protein [Actinomycetota bacterium]|nr:acyl carrier protein [Actinomycetota bacterium]